MNLFNIYAPDIHEGDAVGNHCLGLARAARRLGFNVRLYAQRYSLLSRSEKIYPADMLIASVKSDDIVFLSYSIYDSILDEVLSLPCKKICYFHDVTPPELLIDYEPITAELCKKSIEQFSKLNDFDKILANSEQSAITLGNYGVNKSIGIIPPVFSDSALFNYSPKNIHLENKCKDILCVGRVVPHKKIEDVISTFSHVKRVLSEKCRLSIVGNMPNNEYTKYLINHAKSLGVLEYITFCGMLSEQDLFSRYSGSDLLISMSKHEGFCIPILEAMYFGVPVVIRSGTAADEVGGSACTKVSDVEGAYKKVIEILTNRHGINLEKEVGNRAQMLLDRTSDDKWQSIITTL